MAVHNHTVTLVQKLGILVFVFFAGIPALEESGFGFGLALGLPLCLGIATLGGGLGGAMLAPRKHWAGLIGGLVAGPSGLLAVYYYAQGRESLWNVELVAVQMVASLPGLGLYYLLCWLTPEPKEWEPNSEEQLDHLEEKRP